MRQKRFKIEYKDSIDMRCTKIVYAKSEKKAIINFQLGLMSQDDYMSQLIYIEEVPEDTTPEWTLEDGTPLGENFQEALNDAMSTYTNSDGLTLEQAMELASQSKNKQYDNRR